MLPKEIQPYKVDKVGDRLSILEAYKIDLDFWGNGERKLYNTITKSLVQFFVDRGYFGPKTVTKEPDVVMHDGTPLTVIDLTGFVVNWCDVGCGAGFFFEGLVESAEAAGLIVQSSGVDISPEALARCRSLWPSGEFTEVNLDTYKRLEANYTMPWIAADVVSFIDTLQSFKDYRRSFNEIYNGMKLGAFIVIGDGMIRSNFRDYPRSMDTVATVGAWTDYSMVVTPRNHEEPGSKNRYLKYRIYRKMS